MEFPQIIDVHVVIIKIYKLLNFCDQLNLSRVHPQLKSIFEAHIWKEKYHTMEITEEYGEYVVTTGQSTTTSPLIMENEEVFNNFLDCYADNVRDLTVYELNGIEINDIMREFRNLTKLRYERVNMPMTHLSRLAKNCRNLQELQFHHCSMGRYYIDLELGKMPTIKALSKLRNLKRLSIENNKDPDLPYEVFRQVVDRLKLESFKQRCSLNADQIKRKRKKRHPVQLKELYIGAWFDPQLWTPATLPLYLANFENLVYLKISTRATDVSLATIAQTCINLQKLIFYDTHFENVIAFPIPPNVCELSLEHCKSLKYSNLKQLLSQLKCAKFTSKSTFYEGQTMDEFELSPHIESLNVDSVKTKNFKSYNLKALAWYDDDREGGDREIATISANKKLEILHIKSGTVTLDLLLQLKYLHTLSITESMSGVNWFYVTALLQHSPLRELKIIGQPYRSLLCERSKAPITGFPTQITTLQISFDTFRESLRFWLDLYQINANLKLIVNNIKTFEEFLQKFLNDDNFPRDLRTLEIWGITINCRNLRRNFDETMNKFVQDANYVRTDGDLFNLILSR